MFSKNVIKEAREKSIDLLKQLSTEKGFIASIVDKDNYKRVWGRDGVIAGIASLTTKDKDLINTFKLTLETLKKHQDETGRIPSNVSLDEENISYGTTVGRIDSTIWYIIGACKYILEIDRNSLNEFKESIEKALFYLKCLELNGRSLIYIPAGGDWADEYVNEGYVLFDQALYAIALKLSSKVLDSKELAEKEKNLLKIIEINYFPNIKNLENEKVYNKNIFKKACEKYEPPMPITSFSPFDVVYIHDLFAMSLIFNSEMTNKKQDKEIDSYLNKNKKDFPILPAFSPVIDKYHRKWDALTHNFLFNFKNKPNEFHNGGLWPLVHGFYLASKSSIKKEELKEFAEVLKRDNYIFPEFYNGETFEPGGTGKLGFSASGYLLAYDRLKNNNKPL
jgi:GH15 family glucan-1,4-alpha-glucosidase